MNSPQSNTTIKHYHFFHSLWNSKLYGNSAQWIIIAIALVPLLLVQQVSRNMIEGISKRIIETDSYHVLFQPYKSTFLSTPSTRNPFIHSIQNVEGVSNVYLEIRGIGLLRNGNKKTGVSIRGIDNKLLQNKDILQYLQVVDGTLSLKTHNEILLGHAIAKTLGVKVGDTVLLLTPRINQTNTISLPKISRNIVAGVVSTGYEELDRSWVFTSLERAEALIPEENKEIYLGVKIYDPFIIKNSLVSRSDKEHQKGSLLLETLRSKSYSHGQIHTWYSLNYSRYQLFTDTKRLLTILLFISVILAAVTLSSTMTMKVVDMEIDIAMLKAIGANPQMLEQQIFIRGLIYGTLGSIVGCAIGLFLSLQVNTLINIIDYGINTLRSMFGYSQAISILSDEYYLSEIPIRIYPGDMILIIGFTIVLSVIAAWIPARKLRKISPLKIIRRH